MENNIINWIKNIIFSIKPIYSCIIIPVNNCFIRMSSICILNDNLLKRKLSDPETNIVQPQMKRRISISNLNELSNETGKKSDNEYKYLLDINSKIPFVKNMKSKSEINRKIEYMETGMYIKCSNCKKIFGDKIDIYCMMDKFYCSEKCRLGL